MSLKPRHITNQNLSELLQPPLIIMMIAWWYYCIDPFPNFHWLSNLQLKRSQLDFLRLNFCCTLNAKQTHVRHLLQAEMLYIHSLHHHSEIWDKSNHYRHKWFLQLPIQHGALHKTGSGKLLLSKLQHCGTCGKEGRGSRRRDWWREHQRKEEMNGGYYRLYITINY